MNPLQTAFDRVHEVQRELTHVRTTLYESWRAATGQQKHELAETLANSERTYLIRLLAEFEGALNVVGPTLNPPVMPSARPSLGELLDRVGAAMSMDAPFCLQIDDQLREHRNELAHGRSRVPRISFEDSVALVKQFLRGCR